MARKPKATENETAPNVSADTINEYIAGIIDLDSQMARIKQKMQTLHGRFEKLGCNQQSAKRIIKMMKLDSAEAAMQHATDVRYLFATGVLSTMSDDWREKAQQAPLDLEPASVAASGKLAAARAHADGYNSGRAGAPIDSCGFPPGSEELVSWRDGWDEGRIDRLAANPNADKEKQAVPRKRKGEKTPAVSDEPAGHA